MNFTFTGSTALTPLWQNATITTASGSPPPALQGSGSTVGYNPDTQIIAWNKPTIGEIPKVLNSATVNTILGLNITSFTLTRTVTFNMTSGIQYSDNTGNPNINVTLWQTFSGGRETIFTTNLATNNDIGTGDPATDIGYCNPTFSPPCPSFSFDFQSGQTLEQVQVIPWNSCRAIACSNHDVSQFGMTAQMSIVLSVNCSASQGLIDSDFCLTYCLDNLPVCKQPYQNFCFSPVAGVTGPSIQMSGNTGCQQFFKDYYTTIGPESSIDDEINSYCAEKYGIVGFAGLFNTTPPSNFEKQLCACHMPQSFYDEYKDSVGREFPNFVTFIDNSGINEKCLVSPCASSPFSSTDIRKGDVLGCQIPACIQVVDFNVNGSFSGNANITQNNSTCVAIQSGTTGATGSNGPSEKSFWEKHWVWILLGIGIFVVLIIAILIIIAAESGKKKEKT